jgi:putative FmdB family regulatory protein
MPIYEYQCGKCGRIEEAIQKFSDKPLTTCKHCSGHLQKLISQSAFHLKGSGWYVTDYANKRSSRDNKASASISAKDQGSKVEANTETKKTDSD